MSVKTRSFGGGCGTAEPEDAQRGAVHSGPSRIKLSWRGNGRDNATQWLCRLFPRVVRAAGHARSFFTTGGRCAVPGELVVEALTDGRGVTHDRHRPDPGRGAAGERRHGGAAGRPRTRRVHLPLRGHRRGRGPVVAAGSPECLGQRGRAAGAGAGRGDRAPARPARDVRSRQRLGRPRRRPAARPGAGPRVRPGPAAQAPPPRSADPGHLREPGPLPRRPRAPPTRRYGTPARRPRGPSTSTCRRPPCRSRRRRHPGERRRCRRPRRPR
ncbi:hypothetical protein RKD37_007105 [Streptomyces ambofaciens]